MAAHLTEILRKPVAPWVLRILAKVKQPLTRDELFERLSQKFARHERGAPSSLDVDADLVFLRKTGTLELRDDGRYAITPAGVLIATEIQPMHSTHPA